jgi:hypothetical protein
MKPDRTRDTFYRCKCLQGRPQTVGVRLDFEFLHQQVQIIWIGVNGFRSDFQPASKTDYDKRLAAFAWTYKCILDEGRVAFFGILEISSRWWWRDLYTAIDQLRVGMSTMQRAPLPIELLLILELQSRLPPGVRLVPCG